MSDSGKKSYECYHADEGDESCLSTITAYSAESAASSFVEKEWWPDGGFEVMREEDDNTSIMVRELGAKDWEEYRVRIAYSTDFYADKVEQSHDGK